MSESKIWVFVFIAAAFYWLAGCETKEEKERRQLMERIEDLESETDYLMEKLERKRY